MPEAKKKLQELVDKVQLAVKLPPEVQSLVDPVLAGLKTGAGKFADEAVLCREAITGINLASLKGAFWCLQQAFKTGVSTAGAGIAQALYDAFVKLLRTNVPEAKKKLQELANKLPKLPVDVKTLAQSVVAGLNAGATKFANDALLCRQMITGFNLESIKGTFGCLKLAFKTVVAAPGGGRALGLYNAFVKLLRTSVPKAKAKLQEFADKLSLPAKVKALARSVIAGLPARANPFVDDAVLCWRMITALDVESVHRTFSCLKLVFRTGAGSTATKASSTQ